MTLTIAQNFGFFTVKCNVLLGLFKFGLGIDLNVLASASTSASASSVWPQLWPQAFGLVQHLWDKLVKYLECAVDDGVNC